MLVDTVCVNCGKDSIRDADWHRYQMFGYLTNDTGLGIICKSCSDIMDINIFIKSLNPFVVNGDTLLNLAENVNLMTKIQVSGDMVKFLDKLGFEWFMKEVEAEVVYADYDCNKLKLIGDNVDEICRLSEEDDAAESIYWFLKNKV